MISKITATVFYCRPHTYLRGVWISSTYYYTCRLKQLCLALASVPVASSARLRASRDVELKSNSLTTVVNVTATISAHAAAAMPFHPPPRSPFAPPASRPVAPGVPAPAAKSTAVITRTGARGASRTAQNLKVTVGVALHVGNAQRAEQHFQTVSTLYSEHTVQ